VEPCNVAPRSGEVTSSGNSNLLRSGMPEHLRPTTPKRAAVPGIAGAPHGGCLRSSLDDRAGALWKSRGPEECLHVEGDLHLPAHGGGGEWLETGPSEAEPEERRRLQCLVEPERRLPRAAVGGQRGDGDGHPRQPHLLAERQLPALAAEDPVEGESQVAPP